MKKGIIMAVHESKHITTMAEKLLRYWKMDVF
jgi:hypothetical protein